MSTLADPENDQDTGQATGADRDASLDQQGASPLSAGETSRLDQISAGLKAAGGIVGGNKKKFLLGGGGVGFIAFIIIGFFALLPLKLEAVIKNVFQKEVGNKIEYMMEKRADKLTVRFLGERLTGNGAIYANSSIIKTMYGNWAKNKFETKFTENSGIKIEKADRGGIKLTAADGISTEYKNADEFQKFLDKGTLKGLDARKFIRTVTRNETKWYQVYKRRNLRRFLRGAYGIHKWSWFTGKEGKDAETEVVGEEEASQADVMEREAPRIIECATNETTDCEQSSRDQPEGDPGAEARPDPTGSDDPEVKTETKGAITDSLDKVKKYSPSKLAEQGLSKILSQVMEKDLTDKISSRALPFAGTLLLADQLARMDHFFSTGKADAAVRQYHKRQYATEFSAFASMSDNWKDPAKIMSGDEFNAVMNQLGDVSKSCDSNGKHCQTTQAYNETFLGKPGGKPLEVGVSDSATPLKDAYSVASYVPLVYPLRAWYALVDKNSWTSHFIDAINNGIGAFFSKFIDGLKLIPGVSSAMSSATGAITDAIKPILWKLVGPAVDGTETNGDALSAIHAGGAVVGQDYAYNLGGHPLTAKQTFDMQQSIAANVGEQAPGFFGRLFSTDYPKSVVNQVAANLPSSPSQAVNAGGNYAIAIISAPWHLLSSLFGGWLIPKANADPSGNSLGLTDYGFTDAELNEPIDEADLQIAEKAAAARLGISVDKLTPDQVEPTDCPDPNPKGANLCRLDLATIQAMNSNFTTEDDGGLGDSGSSSSSSGGSGTIGQLPTGSAQDLAKQVLNSPNISLLTTDSKTDVQDAADGLPSPITCTDGSAGGSTSVALKQQLLAALLAISQKYKIGVGYITNGCHTGDSYHYSGAAADIDSINGQAINQSTLSSTNIAFATDLASILPSGSGIGQSGCGLTFAAPSGIIRFPDSCDHIHFQVPR